MSIGSGSFKYNQPKVFHDGMSIREDNELGCDEHKKPKVGCEACLNKLKLFQVNQAVEIK